MSDSDISNISVFDFSFSIISSNGKTENEAIKLFNRLALELKLAHPRIRALTELHPYIYAIIFEATFGYAAPDVLHSVSTLEENIHNVQAVIDCLSLDILNLSLSQITAEDVVAGKPEPISRLLRVFEGCLRLLRNQDLPMDDSGKESSTSKSSLGRNLQASKSHKCHDNVPTNIIPKNVQETTGSPNYLSSSSSTSCYKEHRTSDGRMDSSFGSNNLAKIHHLKKNKTNLEPDESSLISKSDVPRPEEKPKAKHVPTPAKKRSVLIPRYLRREKLCTHQRRKSHLNNSRISSDNQKTKGGILSEIMGNIPGISPEPQTKNVMRKELSNHIRMTTNKIFELEHRKTKPQKLLEAAIAKQAKLMKLEEKDQKETITLRDIKDLQQTRLKTQRILRDDAISKAKTRQYHQDFNLRHRRSMSSKSTKEEMLLKNLFEDRLKAQKMQVIDVGNRFRLLEEEEAARQSNLIASMENMFENKISDVKEKIQQMRHSKDERQREKYLELDKRKRDLREKRLREVREIQNDLQKRNDFHSREADAGRLQKWTIP